MSPGNDDGRSALKLCSTIAYSASDRRPSVFFSEPFQENCHETPSEQVRPIHGSFPAVAENRSQYKNDKTRLAADRRVLTARQDIAASCCICFPRASFVSATSVSSLTADAPRYCRCASQHWAQFQYRSNRKPPLRNRTLFGVAPSVVDLWRSSNDLPLINSNSVLHHCWSLLQHETARPQLETFARFTAFRPRPPCSYPDPYFALSITPFSNIDSRFHTLARPLLYFCAHSCQPQHLSLAPFNLHKARVRRASGFLLTAFSNARPNPLFRSTLITKDAPPKKH